MTAPAAAPHRYRLRSTEYLHAPGFVRWLAVVHRTDAALARRILTESFPGIPEGVTALVLNGRYEVEQESVVVSV